MTKLEVGPDELRHALSQAPPDALPSEACPTPELLWSAVRGELPPPEFRELAAHAIACPACSQAWSLARDVVSEAELDTPPAVATADRRSWVVWSGLAAAAATVAFVTLTLQFWPDRPVSPAGSPAFRATTEEPVRSMLPAAGVLGREQCVLRWSGPEGARYDLRVGTMELDTLYRVKGLEGSEHRVPAEALAKVPDGGSIVWQVEAVFEDGTRLVSRSYVQRLE
jgi:hypothetical protein